MTAQRDATIATSTAMLIASGVYWYHQFHHLRKGKQHKAKQHRNNSNDDDDFAVLPCIRNRRSCFPRQYLRDPPPLDERVVKSLLEAAKWGPFHGRCFAGCQHPAKFVVLGKESMVEMQELTLRYYDQHWKEVGWGSGGHDRKTEGEYAAWRQMTQDEITGRWAPCHYMIAICMRRQTGPKRLPEWEEAAAVAAAVQNMHVQSTKFPELACYWSSWHDAARDSNEMKEFLNMEAEDKCFGFFIVAHVKPHKDRRKRDDSVVAVEWRS